MSRARTVACLLVLATLALASPAQAAEFKWAGQGEAQSLDPHATTEFREVVSPTLWRFKLRKGVAFHDGAPFTADDVLATLERTRTPGADAKTKVQSIADIKKIDDHTIEVTTRRPTPILLSEISDWFMMSKAWCAKNDAMSVADARKGAENYATRNANGTGPFKLVSREPDVRTVLEANSKWWDKPQHNVTRATYMPISNSATRMAALLSGEIDFAQPVPTQDINRLKADSNIRWFRVRRRESSSSASTTSATSCSTAASRTRTPSRTPASARPSTRPSTSTPSSARSWTAPRPRAAA